MSDRCQHYLPQYHTRFHTIRFGSWKTPKTREKAYICAECYKEWDRLWTEYISKAKNITSNPYDCKKILALWNQFFSGRTREVVQFT